MSTLRLDISNEVAVLTLDTPGGCGNILSDDVLLEFQHVLREMQFWPRARGLILCSGKSGIFCEGADLKELVSAHGASERIRRGLVMGASLESLPFPTVAVIDGTCLGGGLELALGFDFRIAGSHPRCQLGLPATKLGLVPCWGGTQRLTRIVGPTLAAEMICFGETIDAERARQIGLVEDVVPSECLIEHARQLIACARESGIWQAQRSKKLRPLGLSAERSSPLFTKTRAQIIAQANGHGYASLAALAAIENGCNLSLIEGIHLESEQSLPLIEGGVTKARIAGCLARRGTRKDAAGGSKLTDESREIDRVGVVGAGIIGSGIATSLVRSNITTRLFDISTSALDKGIGQIAKSLEDLGRNGSSASGQKSAALSNLTPSSNFKWIATCQVAIEAVVDNENAKKQMYRKLKSILSEHAVLASSSSTISITRLAKAWKQPDCFAGIHFLMPVDRMKLVEIVRGEATSDSTVATLVALARRIGKTPIVVRDCPGFLVNRLCQPYINEALALLEEGASARSIDSAATAFGMPLGPLARQDLIGLDAVLYESRLINAAYANRAKCTRILDELVAAGRAGKKSGAGFYNYSADGKGADDPALEPILTMCRNNRQQFSSEQITDRLFLPMLIEASRCLTEGIARDAADLDLGLILGMGLSSTVGGILRWADAVGMKRVLEKLKQYMPLGQRFEPTEQLRDMAAKGQRFYFR
jgi:3-hydroxyacyl-CoA dehydrogenase / enoyl-CoA hydratase / 3-hydroxybutyryl-CoA epimerase / enoyl-CoA isomerase